MTIDDLTIDPRGFWLGAEPFEGPLAFVDLDSLGEVAEPLVLPPCPIIGLGEPAHPLAARLDAVIEGPVGADALARSVLAMPRAAAVIVQLLRLLPALSTEQGLVAESLAYAVLQGSDEHLRWRAAQTPVPPGPEGEVGVERDGDRLIITLDNPAADNAIDRTMRNALHEAFALAAIDPDLRVSLGATGRSFSLGAELSEFGTTTDPATAHAIRTLTLPAHMAARCADRLDVHVQGACMGAGLEIAAWARRITAGPRAWFQLPELAMGVLPGAGGCVSLTRRIGRQRTALMILSGKRLTATQALTWGLVDAIVDGFG